MHHPQELEGSSHGSMIAHTTLHKLIIYMSGSVRFCLDSIPCGSTACGLDWSRAVLFRFIVRESVWIGYTQSCLNSMRAVLF